MASASLHTASPARKRRPSPELILRTYRQECITAGDRGAANRAAALLGISDDTVRRVVARDEAARKAREETPRDLIFTPPDAAYEAERDIINRTHAAELAARLSTDLRQTYVKAERESGDRAAISPHDAAADRRTDEPGNTPHSETLDAAPGHARPDLDEPGAEAPELPPEAFPNPEPNQPAGIPRSPSGGELPEERPRRPEAIIVRQIVRVPEPRQIGGLVGWISTGPMFGPIPIWALLLLAFFALLAQLGLLG